MEIDVLIVGGGPAGLAAALAAGYSAENAVREARRDWLRLSGYTGEESIIY